MLRELSILLEELTGEIVKYDELYNQVKLFFVQLFSCQALKSLPSITITFSPTCDTSVSSIVDSMNYVSIISLLKLFSNWGLLQPDIRTKFLSLTSELEESEKRTTDIRRQLLSELSSTEFVSKFENWNDYNQYTDFIPDTKLASDVDLFIKEQAMKEIKAIVARVRSNIALFNIDKYYLVSICPLAGIDCGLFDFNELLKTTCESRIIQFIDFLDWLFEEYHLQQE